MLPGHITHLGDLTVDGDILTGVFVECSKADLRAMAKNLFGMNVILTPVAICPCCTGDGIGADESGWVSCPSCGGTGHDGCNQCGYPEPENTVFDAVFSATAGATALTITECQDVLHHIKSLKCLNS